MRDFTGNPIQAIAQMLEAEGLVLVELSPTAECDCIVCTTKRKIEAAAQDRANAMELINSEPPLTSDPGINDLTDDDFAQSDIFSSIAEGLQQLGDWQAYVSRQNPGNGSTVERPTPDNIRSTVLALMVELGELANEMEIKAWRPDHRGPAYLPGYKRDAVKKEFGDILAFLGLLITQLETAGFDPGDMVKEYINVSRSNLRRFAGQEKGGR